MPRFRDVYVFREERFAIGVEEKSGKLFLSIPVSNRLVDYDEYYEISKAEFDSYPFEFDRLKDLADRCRQRKEDARLMLKPGADRGVAS